MKMTHINNYSLLIFCIQIMSAYTAPLQMQYQSQLSVQPSQEELLQQQLFALQQLQNLQMNNEWNNYYQPLVTQNQARPMMILLPESQINGLTQIHHETNSPNNFLTKTNDDKELDDKDSDSVVIEAEPHLEPTPEPAPKKAILLVPNIRTISIGDVISAIPFLPIEINVPDTISWIYNGISGIISGIGNRIPTWRPTQSPPPEDNNNVRLLIKRLQNRNQNIPTPILMLPDVAQVYPMPMQI